MGFYDGVRLTEADRITLQDVGDDEVALRARIGIARAETVGANYQESLQYPSLNVRGMAAGGVGAVVTSVVPSEAVAEIDIPHDARNRWTAPLRARARAPRACRLSPRRR